MRAPASGTQSKNGGYTGGLITTASPGRVAARSSSTTPTPTSVTAVTAAGSRSQFQRRAANPAMARPRSGTACAYPASDRCTASRSTSATGGASAKSISATVSGSTSAG